MRLEHMEITATGFPLLFYSSKFNEPPLTSISENCSDVHFFLWSLVMHNFNLAVERPEAISFFVPRSGLEI
jgi:hypothetical protein